MAAGETTRNLETSSSHGPSHHTASKTPTPRTNTSTTHDDDITLSNLFHGLFPEKVVIPSQLPSVDSSHSCILPLTCSLIKPSSNSPSAHSLAFLVLPGVLIPRANLSARSSGVEVPLSARLFSHSSTSSPTCLLSFSVRCSRRSDWKVRMMDVVAIAVVKAVKASCWCVEKLVPSDNGILNRDWVYEFYTC